MKKIIINGQAIDTTKRATANYVLVGENNEQMSHGFSVRYSKSRDALRKLMDSDTVGIFPIAEGDNHIEI